MPGRPGMSNLMERQPARWVEKMREVNGRTAVSFLIANMESHCTQQCIPWNN
jgi:hypothetical protein